MKRVLGSRSMPSSLRSRTALKQRCYLTSRSCQNRTTLAALESPCDDEPPLIAEKGGLRRSSSKPQPPVLLLTGDEFSVSSNGIARTYYEHSGAPVSVEEIYDLLHAHKTYILREHTSDVFTEQREGSSHHRLGRPLSYLNVQEIHQCVYGSAGTGATTWESSIAMSLLVASQPHLLSGNVIELGSGVGVGGILCTSPLLSTHIQSMTLTDYNQQVLEQCKNNVQRAASQHGSFNLLQVEHMDWFEVTQTHKTYDTVLVCDCAYRHSDVPALAHAAKALLSKTNIQSRLHVFGPYNRAALQELVQQLQEDMDVTVEWLDMTRYRLQPQTDTLEACCSKNVAKFLHVTAQHRPTEEKRKDTANMADID